MSAIEQDMTWIRMYGDKLTKDEIHKAPGELQQRHGGRLRERQHGREHGKHRVREVAKDAKDGGDKVLDTLRERGHVVNSMCYTYGEIMIRVRAHLSRGDAPMTSPNSIWEAPASDRRVPTKRIQQQ
ncbi:hypothetical protein Dda_4237 [Drechslerella dactyloides]|uniref:Uncharacterized protein n=1 Tax=Drechslerella dactyloides TaxID=74499 RepID=A0AAD6J3T9_DREDA|nr:hypothetical protein Dda_4237 [Drechslerella dactyloides]